MHRRNYPAVVSEELPGRGATQSLKVVLNPVSRGNILRMRTITLVYRVLFTK